MDDYKCPLLTLLDDYPCKRCGHHNLDHRRELLKELDPPYPCQYEGCECEDIDE